MEASNFSNGIFQVAGLVIAAGFISIGGIGALDSLNPLTSNVQAGSGGVQAGEAVSVNQVPANMEVVHWRDKDGDGTYQGDSNEIINKESSHNIVVDQGLNAIECATAGVSCPSATSAGTFSAGTDYFDVISVGTGSAPTSGDQSLDSEITGNGLQRIQVSASDQGTGNFTLSNTFTATGSVNGVSNTGLHWSTNNADDDLVAGNTFQSVDMLDGDKLTITWTEVSYQ